MLARELAVCLLDFVLATRSSTRPSTSYRRLRPPGFPAATARATTTRAGAARGRRACSPSGSPRGPLPSSSGRLREQRFVDVRVEASVGRDLRRPSRRSASESCAVDEPDALFERRLLVLLRRLERPLEVVEHRQQLLHEPLARARDERSWSRADALAVVVELRCEPVQVVEVRLGLGPRRRRAAPRATRPPPRPRPLLVVGAEVSSLLRRLGLSRRSPRSRPPRRPRRPRRPAPFRPASMRPAPLACAYAASASFCEACWSASVLARISFRSEDSRTSRSSMTRPSIVGRIRLVELVAVLLERLLGLVGERLGDVPGVRELTQLPGLVGVRLGVADHPLDLLLLEAGAALDPDLLLVARAQVLRGDVDDPVRVDVEGDLDLRHAARRRRDPDELELAERLVVERPSPTRPGGRAPPPTAGCRRRS